MNTTLSAASPRMDLERKFVVGFFALLAGGCAAVYLLIAERASVPLSIALIATCVGAIMSLIAHSLLFAPLHRLAVMAKAIASGDFSGRIGSARRDEIGSLSREMDTMCDRLQAAEHAAEAHIAALEQLRHADRVATLGRLASSVAHELGNPLNVIEMRAQLITSGDIASSLQAQQSAQVIVDQTKRMTRIIDEILSFARMQPAKITHLDLVSVLRKAISFSEHKSKRQETSIQLEVPERAIEIDGDADKLLQVFVNLIVNGVQAMSSGGILRVSTTLEQCAALDDPEGALQAFVCVDVADQGIGIPEHLVARIFEPFFSTRGVEGGTGLGLSVAQGIAREHDAWIVATSELGHGSSFKVHLPLRAVHAGDRIAT